MKRRLRNLGDRLSGRAQIFALTICSALIFFVAVAGYFFGSNTASENLAKSSTTSTTQPLIRKGISGFESVSFSVTRDGVTNKYCAALASSNEQLTKGMKNQIDFGGYNGMIFAMAADSEAQFYMANVRFPLSVAFFNGQGVFISAADMEICNVDEKDCPRYGSTSPYRFAIETPKGGLVDLGIAQGSVVSFGGNCT